MKNWSILLLICSTQSWSMECQPPGQGLIEARLKEAYQTNLAETELKEWMNHPKNNQVKQDLRQIDRQIKFSQMRPHREQLLVQSQAMFEMAIQNNERPSELEHFPLKDANSKITGSQGALTIEMSNLPKKELDLLDQDILAKLDSKLKINYYFPYDKFEYVLTYNGEELPMQKALGKVQQDMESACEKRIYDNNEYRRWYKQHHGGEAKAAATGVSNPASGSGRSVAGQ